MFFKVVTGLISGCDAILKGLKVIRQYISDYKNTPKAIQKLQSEPESLGAIIANKLLFKY